MTDEEIKKYCKVNMPQSNNNCDEVYLKCLESRKKSSNIKLISVLSAVSCILLVAVICCLIFYDNKITPYEKQTLNNKEKITESNVINKNLEDYLNEYELDGPVIITKETACMLKVAAIQVKINNCVYISLDGEKIDYTNYEEDDLIKDIEFLLILKREINLGELKADDIKIEDVDALLFQLEKIYYEK